jgi:uroporphyrinogen decarboxylase
MAQLSKRERVDAALKGAPVDRVPVSAWRHFIPEERTPADLARISLKHFYDFDWDWLKVNPRAVYYAEAWGNRYDYEHYESVFPRWMDGPIHSSHDLEKIQIVNASSGVFAEQIDLVHLVKQGIGDAHFLLTVFSPLSVLSFLTARPRKPGVAELYQAQYDSVHEYMLTNPQGVHNALNNIATTLAQFASNAIDAGASGLFFAIVKLARQGILSESEYAEFGAPYDLQVLQAVQGAPFNLLHICGEATYLKQVASYPVHAINWATIGQQNLTIGEAHTQLRQALVGGVDEVNTLQQGTPDQVIEQAREAIQATGGKRLLLAPGCAVRMNVPSANLRALRQAVDLFKP